MKTRHHSPSLSILTLLLSVFGLAGVSGCGEEAAPPPNPILEFPVTVEVDSPTGGVAKVPVLFGEKTVGYTDADGFFKATLTRPSGEPFNISVGQVAGFRYTGDTSVSEVLKSTEVNGQLTGVPLLLEVDAESTRNEYFFWVRANCEDSLDDEECSGVEVKLNDEVIATTNELGYAQFTVDEVPGTEIELMLETPDFDPDADDGIAMEPRDPTYRVALALDPQVYVIQEDFVDALAKKKRRRPRRRSTNRSRSRSNSSQKTTTTKPKEEEKESGVIDLF